MIEKINIKESNLNEYPYNLLRLLQPESKVVGTEAERKSLGDKFDMAIEMLPEEQKFIILNRVKNDKTLEYSADHLGVNINRARRLQTCAFGRLRHELCFGMLVYFR